MTAFRCSDCPRSFSRQGNLNNHVKRHHSNEWKKLTHESLTDIRRNTGREQADEDVIRAFDAFKASISAEQFRRLMTTTSQHTISSSELFNNSSGFDEEYDDDEISGERPVPDENPDDTDRDDRETPVDPDAGAPAFGPIDIHDFERDYNMNNPIPPPFQQESHYNFARWLSRYKVTKEAINELLDPNGNMPIHSHLRLSFTSYHTLQQVLTKLSEHNTQPNWEVTDLQSKWSASSDKVELYRRKPTDIVRMLLAQKGYRDNIHYAPTEKTVVEEDDDGGSRRVRTYEGMHTSDWWRQKQKTLPKGATLIPIILMSDATHLTNFSGDKKCHPIYLTIGNIDTKIRAKPTLRAIQPLALLPVAPKRPEKSSDREWRSIKDNMRRVRHESLSLILEELTNPAFVDGMYAFCSDGQYRSCYLRVSAWIADYPEHIELHGLQSFRCPWCEVGSKELHKHPDEFSGRLPKYRNHRHYEGIFDAVCELEEPRRAPAETLTAFAQRKAVYRQQLAETLHDLTEAGVNADHNPLWELYDCNVGELPKPDKLHTIYLGLIDHLMQWLTDMLHKHGRLDRFKAISQRVPSYQSIPAPGKSWHDVKQWTGKEMKRQVRYLYTVLSATLTEPPPHSTERRHFKDTLDATKALMEICLYLEYASHTEETLGLLETAIKTFFVKKETFKPYRAGKNVRGQAREVRTALIAERDAAIANMTKNGSTPTEVSAERAHWADIIQQDMDDVLTDGAHFNLPKLHMLLHFVENVRKYGGLGQFDTGMAESAHKEFKDAYRASNKVGEWMKQILNRTAAEEIFVLRENWSDYIEIHRKKDCLHATDFKIPPAPPTFIGQRINLGKKGITTMFDVIETSGIPGFLESYVRWVRKHVNQRFSTVDHLRAPASIYNQLEMYVEAHASEEWEVQRLRAVPGISWHGIENRAEWAWIRVFKDTNERWRRTGRPSANSTLNALRGRVPVRLRCLFKVALVDERSENHVYSLVLAEVPVAVNRGQTNQFNGLVTVRRPDTLPSGTTSGTTKEFRGHVNNLGQNLLIFGAVAVDGAAHCIPLEPDEVETSWLVNPHIDLRTWNIVYDTVEI